jgi:tryptophanyl-tRNA synthetase
VRALLTAAVEPDTTPEERARFEAAVDAAQAAFAPYKRTGVDEVEEFLRERREEAERVEARWARLAREAEEARDRERAG